LSELRCNYYEYLKLQRQHFSSTYIADSTEMEEKLTEQDVSGVSSPGLSEIKTSVALSKRTEPPLAQSTGAILKTVTKSRTGGVKLGSFRLGGRKKVNSEGDARMEVKEEKRKSKKYMKGKFSGKPESEDSTSSTPSPYVKQSLPSRTSSLVRKLSIGKYRAGGSGVTVKSPDTPSSQEECNSASTEEDGFFSASPSSAATDGGPSLEEIVSGTPTEDVASPVDQSIADTKVSKSDSDISDSAHSNGDSVTQAMPRIKDTLPKPESPSQDGTPEVIRSEDDSKIDSEVAAPKLANRSDVSNLTEICKHVSQSDQTEEVSPADANDDLLPTSYCKPLVLSEVPSSSAKPLRVKEDRYSKHALWLAKGSVNAENSSEQDTDKRPTTKDQILSITTPLLMKQRQQVEEYFKLIESKPPTPATPYSQKLPDLHECDEMFASRAEKTRSRSPTPDMENEDKVLKKLGIMVSAKFAFYVRTVPTIENNTTLS
jgi:hypothetical protein